MKDPSLDLLKNLASEISDGAKALELLRRAYYNPDTIIPDNIAHEIRDFLSRGRESTIDD